MRLDPCSATSQIIDMLVKVCGIRILNKKENHELRNALISKILAEIQQFETICNKEGGQK